MSAIKGRAVQVLRNSTLLAGVRTKSLKINGSPVDITTDDDSGWRAVLATPGQMEVEITVAGILTGDQLVSEALSTTDRTQTTSFTMPGWAGSPDHSTISGDFFLSALTVGAEYQGAATFEATFVSNGTITLS